MTGEPDDKHYSPMNWFGHLHLSMAFLTRLPLWKGETPGHGALAPAMRMFPVVGAVVGFLGGLTFLGAEALGLPVLASALIALVVVTWVTGALHEDGLADVADGFGGGFDKETKLSIMKDSRAGAFGVLAAVFSVALKASALLALETGGAVMTAFVVAGVLSRAAMPIAMRLMQPARPDGLAASAGRPDEGTALFAGVLALAIAALLLPLTKALIVTAVALAFTFGLAKLAIRQIGGYTGDVIGATAVVVETAVLLTLAVPS